MLGRLRGGPLSTESEAEVSPKSDWSMVPSAAAAAATSSLSSIWSVQSTAADVAVAVAAVQRRGLRISDEVCAAVCATSDKVRHSARCVDAYNKRTGRQAVVCGWVVSISAVPLRLVLLELGQLVLLWRWCVWCVWCG